MTKLEIVEENEEDKYEHVTHVKCWACDSQNGAVVPDALSDPKVSLFLIFLPLADKTRLNLS